MSSAIYQHNVENKNGFRALSPSNNGDSFDLCHRNYTNIFQGISRAIGKVQVPHVYDYWPITDRVPETGEELSFDPRSIKAYKVYSNEREVLIPRSSTNGWSFTDQTYRIQKVRKDPTRGEEIKGYFIELLGDAQVTYPTCMRIETLEALTFGGYLVATEKPDLSSIVYKKNNVSYKKSTQNGWDYIGFKKNHHTRIKSPTDQTIGNPPQSQNGYFFKLYGNAIFGNGDKIIFTYKPAPRVRR